MVIKVIKWFFLSLGVIFFALILLAAYLWITDPWGIKSFIIRGQIESTSDRQMVPVATDDTGSSVIIESTTGTPGTVLNDSADQHPTLTSGQEDALELIGIDPGVLPSEITPEQEACFITKLGEERVLAIKAGATPQVSEIFKAKECMSL